MSGIINNVISIIFILYTNYTIINFIYDDIHSNYLYLSKAN